MIPVVLFLFNLILAYRRYLAFKEGSIFDDNTVRLIMPYLVLWFATSALWMLSTTAYRFVAGVSGEIGPRLGDVSGSGTIHPMTALARGIYPLTLGNLWWLAVMLAVNLTFGILTIRHVRRLLSGT